jgi:beta-N-acetylhexosaminidase
MPAVSSSAADRQAAPRAAIVGVAAQSLSPAETELFRRARPAGFILFRRNCADPEQVQRLIGELRALPGCARAPVLIDQEGGRVARLCPPVWPGRCALRTIGELAAAEPDLGCRAAWLHARLIASDLAPLGIDVVCAPVLDLGLAGQTDAIGDRAFGSDPMLVGRLGAAAIEGFMDGGVLPVIKHLPGHGRAAVDSHLKLPVVDADRTTLRSSDWRPFMDNRAAPFAMTAHIVYPALDGTAPATQSRRIIADVIRGEIGFAGALLSDDLSMEALSGALGERAAAARGAGCDIALHCNGRLDEAAAVLEAAGRLEGAAAARVEGALAARRRALPFDPDDGARALEALLSVAGTGGHPWTS